MPFFGKWIMGYATRLLVTLALVVLASAPAVADLAGEELLDALRSGGFNIYFRHAGTDWSQRDDIADLDDTASCDGARVRQLSPAGRADSEAVGRAIRALGIPVGEILSSPYCRCMDTARLMDLGEVTATEDLMNLRAAHLVGGRDAVVARARALLASAPPPGTNRILVAHGNLATAATPVYPGEAEGVVFRPDGSGGFEPVARLAVEAWTTLAAEFSR